MFKPTPKVRWQPYFELIQYKLPSANVRMLRLVLTSWMAIVSKLTICTAQQAVPATPTSPANSQPVTQETEADVAAAKQERAPVPMEAEVPTADGSATANGSS